MAQDGGPDGDGPRGPGHRAERFFEEFDANKDGKVTKAEMDNHRAARFEKTDTNKDGAINFDEFYQASLERHKTHMERMFQRMDANKDGAVTLEEMKEARGKRGWHRGHRGAKDGDKE